MPCHTAGVVTRPPHNEHVPNVMSEIIRHRPLGSRVGQFRSLLILCAQARKLLLLQFAVVNIGVVILEKPAGQAGQ